MKKIILLSIILLTVLSSFSQGLKVKNKSQYPVQFCIGIHKDGDYTTHGWYKLAPYEENVYFENTNQVFLIWGQQTNGGQ